MKTSIPVHAHINLDQPHSEELFFIKKILHQPGTNNQIPELHRHPYYEMLFIMDGEGEFQVDFQRNPYTKGTLFFFSPGQTHIAKTQKDLYMYILRFELPLFQEKGFFDNISVFNFDSLQLDGDDYLEVEGMLKNLYEEFNQEQQLKEMTINNLLKLFLIKLQRLLPDVINSTPDTTLFNALNDLMEHNGYKMMSPSDYAKQLKVPMHLLNNAVREYTGKTSGDYIRSKTVIEIKRLLYYTDLNTNEIAWKLDFTDPGYFSRFFKREVGMTPTNFRKMYLQEKAC